MPGFSTLNTAISGLMAAQRGLDVTGQNIVNANTAGYSRQVVRTKSVGATTAADFHTHNTADFSGGVTIESVGRIRDAFSEGARVSAGASLEALTAQSTALSGAENLLTEPSDTGLQNTLDDFYAGWHDLASNPGGSGAGSVVVTRGQTVAAQLRFASSGVVEGWTTAHDGLQGVVGEVNQAASDLASVNQKIREGTVADRPVNELLDQRDTLVRKLGELIGARGTAGPDGVMSVQVNGMQLVSETHAEKFSLTGADHLSAATDEPPTITSGNLTVSVQSGRAAGLLAAVRTDLPSVAAKLDGIANALRDAVNTVHQQGWTIGGAAGGDFFSGTGALDLEVVPTGPDELAVSAAEGAVDGGNALALGDLSIDTNAADVLGGQPGPSARVRELTGSLGTQVQSLRRAITVQTSVVDTADAAVESSAGVNLDEEMANLLQYQRSYQASARVITAIDEVLDTLVNRLGTIGR